jgi:hypothetical protein
MHYYERGSDPARVGAVRSTTRFCGDIGARFAKRTITTNVCGSECSIYNAMTCSINSWYYSISIAAASTAKTQWTDPSSDQLRKPSACCATLRTTSGELPERRTSKFGRS